MEETEVKHNCIIYSFCKSVGKKVYKSPLVLCIKVRNKKCESDLILTEMIIVEFRECVVLVIHLCIISVYFSHLCVFRLFNFEQ